jgi:hypothetical protein
VWALSLGIKRVGGVEDDARRGGVGFLGFRVEGLNCRIQGFGVWGVVLGFWNSGFRE